MFLSRKCFKLTIVLITKFKIKTQGTRIRTHESTVVNNTSTRKSKNMFKVVYNKDKHQVFEVEDLFPVKNKILFYN